MKILKSFNELYKYNPWLYIINIVVWSLVEVVQIFPPLIIKIILDSFDNNFELNKNFWWLIALTIIVYVVRIILTYMGCVVGVYHGFKIKSLLRHNILKGILSYPASKALNVSPSEALNRFRDDIEELNEAFTWPIDVFVKMVLAIIAVVILIQVNAQMTFVVIIPLFIVLSIIQQVRKKVYKYRQKSREATSQVVSSMGEMFSATLAIQVANAEEDVINHLHKLNKSRHNAMLKDTLFVKGMGAVLNNVEYLGVGLILLMSSYSITAGNFSIGDFSLFIGYWFLVSDFAGNFGNLISAYHQGKVSLKRLIELLYKSPSEDLVKHEKIKLLGKLPKLERDIVNEDKLIKLEIKNLSYNHENNMVGIKNVNLKVNKGSFTVITGRVGSGKSTLIKCLLGLLPYDNGKIMWNDKVIDNPENFFIPPRAAYTGQVPHLFSDTVKNNILLGRYDEDVNLDKAIKSAVFEEDLNELENGLDTIVGPRGVKLSGGQIQRLAAARMFASNSDLYVFDDISSALDVNTERILWSRLFENKEATCIAVSNRSSALEKADNIIVMKNGEILSKGTLEELIETCDEFKQIYEKKLVYNA